MRWSWGPVSKARGPEGDGRACDAVGRSPKLPGDALDHSRRERAMNTSRSSASACRHVGVGSVSPPRTGLPRSVGHPIEVDLPSMSLHSSHWKGALTETA